jgi:hypothetical protein
MKWYVEMELTPHEGMAETAAEQGDVVVAAAVEDAAAEVVDAAWGAGPAEASAAPVRRIANWINFIVACLLFWKTYWIFSRLSCRWLQKINKNCIISIFL